MSIPLSRPMDRPAVPMIRRVPWTLVVFLVLLPMPWVGSRYDTFLATQIAIDALFAVSLNLLLGTTGLVSFGHVAYFGVGAYVCGILMKTYGVPFIIAFPASGLGAAAFSLVFGYFCVRLTKIYFAMLTLAFSQIVWAIAFKWDAVTGGDQGIADVPFPDMHWMGSIPFIGDLSENGRFYILTLTLVALSIAAIGQITRSPFGRMLTAIRDNRERAAFIGLNVRAYELSVFVVAGGFAGFRRRAVRHLHPRRVPRLRVLAAIRRGHDHDHPGRHELFLGTGGRRLRAGVAEPGDHQLYTVLAVRAGHHPVVPVVPAAGRRGGRPGAAVRLPATAHGAARCLKSPACANPSPASLR